MECIHCKKRLTFNSIRTTSTWNRHMNACLKHKQYLRTQQLLNFRPVDIDVGLYKPLPLITPDAKYDVNKMREAIANWLMVTEQPFSTVEDEMFVYMMKTANPLFERISRPTAKADCFKVYEHEKKKLKALTNALSNIRLTTDCWRSSHQKIEYMVITGHFIDQNWRVATAYVLFIFMGCFVVSYPRSQEESNADADVYDQVNILLVY
ncbi:zinc finger BED domain-containing protein RICESLEEPER 2 [Artemisia annua]|uniref:Zinc finger BED domain-containing protein RICESLEEPER 2 n=1 Tax=Artemisia annua TaxID=35608 RepID=A0A2U1QKM4_ARTAN|nr:zinc finger BED domain-containing protein RICESLEEPER 2 [Artemisia annua]